MSLITRISMPRLDPIRWRKDGYGTQVVWMPAAGTSVQRGYVKIWKDGEVVDRALTVKAARRRIKRMKST